MIQTFPKPNFIGIGAQKCATTWLSECLRSHPQVFMSSPKEIHFWGHRNFQRGIEWYLDHFRGSDNYDAIGEFSPSYLTIENTAEQIYNYLGSVKIIVSFRDPILRFISHYKQYVRDGALSKRIITKELFLDVTKRYPALLNNGNYGKSLANYFSVFGSENIMILFKENIDKNPRKEICRLYRFLHVDERFTPPEISRIISPGILPKYQFLERSRIRLFYFFQAHTPQFIDIVRKSGLADLYRRFNEKREAEMLIEDAVSERLREYYRPEISTLRRLLGKNDNNTYPDWLEKS
jgi:hypothetical protein